MPTNHTSKFLASLHAKGIRVKYPSKADVPEKYMTHSSFMGGVLSFPDEQNAVFLNMIAKDMQSLILTRDITYTNLYTECFRTVFPFVLDIDIDIPFQRKKIYDRMKREESAAIRELSSFFTQTAIRCIVESYEGELATLQEFDDDVFALVSSSGLRKKPQGDLKLGIHIIFPTVIVNKSIAMVLMNIIKRAVLNSTAVVPALRYTPHGQFESSMVDGTIYGNSIRMPGCIKKSPCECVERESYGKMKKQAEAIAEKILKKVKLEKKEFEPLKHLAGAKRLWLAQLRTSILFPMAERWPVRSVNAILKSEVPDKAGLGLGSEGHRKYPELVRSFLDLTEQIYCSVCNMRSFVPDPTSLYLPRGAFNQDGDYIDDSRTLLESDLLRYVQLFSVVILDKNTRVTPGLKVVCDSSGQKRKLSDMSGFTAVSGDEYEEYLRYIDASTSKKTKKSATKGASVSFQAEAIHDVRIFKLLESLFSGKLNRLLNYQTFTTEKTRTKSSNSVLRVDIGIFQRYRGAKVQKVKRVVVREKDKEPKDCTSFVEVHVDAQHAQYCCMANKSHRTNRTVFVVHEDGTLMARCFSTKIKQCTHIKQRLLFVPELLRGLCFPDTTKKQDTFLDLFCEDILNGKKITDPQAYIA